MKNCNITTVKKVEKHEALTQRYLRMKKKNWLSPEEQKAIKTKLGFSVTNEMRSKVEIYYFNKDKPKTYFIYIDATKKIATTWTGDNLGVCHFGQSYKSNFGDIRQNIDVYGINGVKYHGVYFKSSGNYARLKAYKN
jgi:hypothetical protein